jgi:hypothetical protein
MKKKFMFIISVIGLLIGGVLVGCSNELEGEPVEENEEVPASGDVNESESDTNQGETENPESREDSGIRNQENNNLSEPENNQNGVEGQSEESEVEGESEGSKDLFDQQDDGPESNENEEEEEKN